MGADRWSFHFAHVYRNDPLKSAIGQIPGSAYIVQSDGSSGQCTKVGLWAIHRLINTFYLFRCSHHTLISYINTCRWAAAKINGQCNYGDWIGWQCVSTINKTAFFFFSFLIHYCYCWLHYDEYVYEYQFDASACVFCSLYIYSILHLRWRSLLINSSIGLERVDLTNWRSQCAMCWPYMRFEQSCFKARMLRHVTCY